MAFQSNRSKTAPVATTSGQVHQYRVVSNNNSNRSYGGRSYDGRTSRTAPVATTSGQVHQYKVVSNKSGRRMDTPAVQIPQQKFSWSDKTSTRDMDFAEYIAWGRHTGKDTGYFDQAKAALSSAGSRYYNPYFNKTSTQTAARQFFKDHYGYDGAFDDAFFQQFLGLRNYETRSDVSGSLTSPGSKGSTEQWAAYWYNQLLMDKSTQDDVDRQWNDLRADSARWYSDFQSIYGRKPTADEFISSIDISKYSALKKIDDSRNFGGVDSSKLVQLNTGTYYSRESLYGLYNVLKNGGDVSEDRNYFEDAVSYYLSPLEPESQKNAYDWQQYDLSVATPESVQAYSDYLRMSGNLAEYTAFQNARYQSGQHMDSVDASSFYGDAYKDDAWFESVTPLYEKYIGQMMNPDGSVKAPNQGDPMIYHAVYEIHQALQRREDTDKLEEQWSNLLKLVSDLSRDGGYITSNELKEDVEAYISDHDQATSMDFDLLNSYLSGENVQLCRANFISQQALDRVYQAALWGVDVTDPNVDYALAQWQTSGGKVVDVSKPLILEIPEIPETVDAYAQSRMDLDERIDENIRAALSDEDEPEAMDPVLSGLADQRDADIAAQIALSAKESLDAISQDVLALANSPVILSERDIAASGIAVLPAQMETDPVAQTTLSVLWQSFRANNYRDVLGDGYTAADAASIDPVLKMLGTSDPEAVVPSLGGVYDLLSSVRTSDLANNSYTIASGALNLVVPQGQALMTLLSDIGVSSPTSHRALTSISFDAGVYSGVVSEAAQSGYDGKTAAAYGLCANILAADSDLFDAVSPVPVSGNLYTLSSIDRVVSSFGGAEKFLKTYAELSVDENGVRNLSTQDFLSALSVGQSKDADPGFAAQTQDILHGISNGDITTEDLHASLQAVNRAYEMDMLTGAVERPNGASAEAKSLADEMDRNTGVQPREEVSEQTENPPAGYYDAMGNFYPDAPVDLFATEWPRFEDRPEVPAADPQTYVQDAITYGDNTFDDILNNMTTGALKDELEIPRTRDMQVPTMLNRAGAIVGFSREEVNEAYAYLDAYKSWFSPHQYAALENAYAYDGLNLTGLKTIISEHVNRMLDAGYDTTVLHGMSEKGQRGIQENIESMTERIDSFLSIRGAVPGSEDVAAAARDALERVNAGISDELVRYLYEDMPEVLSQNVDFVQIVQDIGGDFEAALPIFKERLQALIDEEPAEAEEVMGVYEYANTGVLVGVQDVKVMGALTELYSLIEAEQPGYGYAYLSAMDQKGGFDYLNKAYGLDLETDQLADYSLVQILDIASGYTFSHPYSSPTGIGLESMIWTGVEGGVDSLASIPVHLLKWTSDLTTETLGFDNNPFDGYIQNNLQYAELRNLYLQNNATFMEQLGSNAISEVIRMVGTGKVAQAIGAASGSAGASKVFYGATVFGREYVDERAADASFVAATLKAAISAGIESYTESRYFEKTFSDRLLGRLDDLTANAGNFALFKAYDAARNIASEILEEEASTILGTAVDVGEAAITGDGDIGAILAGMPQEMATDALATLLTMGILETGNIVTDYRSYTQNRDSIDAAILKILTEDIAADMDADDAVETPAAPKPEAKLPPIQVLTDADFAPKVEASEAHEPAVQAEAIVPDEKPEIASETPESATEIAKPVSEVKAESPAIQAEPITADTQPLQGATSPVQSQTDISPTVDEKAVVPAPTASDTPSGEAIAGPVEQTVTLESLNTAMSEAKTRLQLSLNEQMDLRTQLHAGTIDADTYQQHTDKINRQLAAYRLAIETLNGALRERQQEEARISAQQNREAAPAIQKLTPQQVRDINVKLSELRYRLNGIKRRQSQVYALTHGGIENTQDVTDPNAIPSTIPVKKRLKWLNVHPVQSFLSPKTTYSDHLTGQTAAQYYSQRRAELESQIAELESALRNANGRPVIHLPGTVDTAWQADTNAEVKAEKTDVQPIAQNGTIYNLTGVQQKLANYATDAFLNIVYTALNADSREQVEALLKDYPGLQAILDQITSASQNVDLTAAEAAKYSEEIHSLDSRLEALIRAQADNGGKQQPETRQAEYNLRQARAAAMEKLTNANEKQQAAQATVDNLVEKLNRMQTQARKELTAEQSKKLEESRAAAAEGAGDARHSRYGELLARQARQGAEPLTDEEYDERVTSIDTIGAHGRVTDTDMMNPDISPAEKVLYGSARMVEVTAPVYHKLRSEQEGKYGDAVDESLFRMRHSDLTDDGEKVDNWIGSATDNRYRVVYVSPDGRYHIVQNKDEHTFATIVDKLQKGHSLAPYELDYLNEHYENLSKAYQEMRNLESTAPYIEQRRQIGIRVQQMKRQVDNLKGRLAKNPANASELRKTIRKLNGSLGPLAKQMKAISAQINAISDSRNAVLREIKSLSTPPSLYVLDMQSLDESLVDLGSMDESFDPERGLLSTVPSALLNCKTLKDAIQIYWLMYAPEGLTIEGAQNMQSTSAERIQECDNRLAEIPKGYSPLTEDQVAALKNFLRDGVSELTAATLEAELAKSKNVLPFTARKLIEKKKDVIRMEALGAQNALSVLDSVKGYDLESLQQLILDDYYERREALESNRNQDLLRTDLPAVATAQFKTDQQASDWLTRNGYDGSGFASTLPVHYFVNESLMWDYERRYNDASPEQKKQMRFEQDGEHLFPSLSKDERHTYRTFTTAVEQALMNLDAAAEESGLTPEQRERAKQQLSLMQQLQKESGSYVGDYDSDNVLVLSSRHADAEMTNARITDEDGRPSLALALRDIERIYNNLFKHREQNTANWQSEKSNQQNKLDYLEALKKREDKAYSFNDYLKENKITSLYQDDAITIHFVDENGYDNVRTLGGLYKNADGGYERFWIGLNDLMNTATRITVNYREKGERVHYSICPTNMLERAKPMSEVTRNTDLSKLSRKMLNSRIAFINARLNLTNPSAVERKRITLDLLDTLTARLEQDRMRILNAISPDLRGVSKSYSQKTQAALEYAEALMQQAQMITSLREKIQTTDFFEKNTPLDCEGLLGELSNAHNLGYAGTTDADTQAGKEKLYRQGGGALYTELVEKRDKLREQFTKIQKAKGVYPGDRDALLSVYRERGTGLNQHIRAMEALGITKDSPSEYPTILEKRLNSKRDKNVAPTAPKNIAAIKAGMERAARVQTEVNARKQEQAAQQEAAQVLEKEGRIPEAREAHDAASMEQSAIDGVTQDLTLSQHFDSARANSESEREAMLRDSLGPVVYDALDTELLHCVNLYTQAERTGDVVAQRVYRERIARILDQTAMLREADAAVSAIPTESETEQANTPDVPAPPERLVQALSDDTTEIPSSAAEAVESAPDAPEQASAPAVDDVTDANYVDPDQDADRPDVLRYDIGDMEARMADVQNEDGRILTHEEMLEMRERLISTNRRLRELKNEIDSITAKMHESPANSATAKAYYNARRKLIQERDELKTSRHELAQRMLDRNNFLTMLENGVVFPSAPAEIAQRLREFDGFFQMVRKKLEPKLRNGSLTTFTMEEIQEAFTEVYNSANMAKLREAAKSMQSAVNHYRDVLLRLQLEKALLDGRVEENKAAVKKARTALVNSFVDRGMDVQEANGYVDKFMLECNSGKYGGGADAGHAESVRLAKLIDAATSFVERGSEAARAMYLSSTGDPRMAVSGDYGGVMPVQFVGAIIGALRAQTKEKVNPSNMFSSNLLGVQQAISRFLKDDPVAASLLYSMYFRPVRDANGAIGRKKMELMRRLKDAGLDRRISDAVFRYAEGTLDDAALRKDWSSADADRIRATSAEFRKIYDELIAENNAAMERNGLDAIEYRKNYMPHMQSYQTFLNAVFMGFKGDNSVPASIIGQTADFKPMHKWNPFARQRLGNATKTDALGSFNAYMNSILPNIYQTDNITRLRQLVSYLRATSDYDDLGRTQTAANKGRLSTLTGWLENQANVISGKTVGVGTRSETANNRKIFAVLSSIKTLRSAAILCGNVKSATSNMIPLVQAAAIAPVRTLTGMYETIRSLASDGPDGFRSYTEKSEFLSGLRANEAFDVTKLDAIIRYGYLPMQWLDVFTKTSVHHAIYSKCLSQFQNESVAMAEADSMCAGLFSSRNAGEGPLAYRNPLLGTALQFTQEAVSMLGWAAHDLRRYAGYSAPKYILQLIGMMLGFYLFNQAFGSTSAPDVIGAAKKAFANSENENLGDYVRDLTGNLLETLNPAQRFMSDGVTGIPVVAGFANTFASAGKALSGEISAADFFLNAAGDWLPFGTAGVRAYRGLADVQRGYSETSGGNVRYAIDPTAFNYASAALFGSSTTTEGREFYNSQASVLSATQAEEMKSYMRYGFSPSDAYAIVTTTRDGESKLSDLNDRIEALEFQGKNTWGLEQEAAEVREGMIPAKIDEASIQRLNTPYVQTGLELWRASGNSSVLPTPFEGSTLTLDDGTEVSTIKRSGRKYDLTAEELAYLNRRYWEMYERVMNGAYSLYSGDVDKIAAQLTRNKTRIKNDFIADRQEQEVNSLGKK